MQQPSIAEIRRRRASERGELKAQVIMTFAFFALVLYLGFKFVPVYIAAYDFDSAMKTQAQYAGGAKSEAVIVKELLAKAAELELPIKKENIKIQRNTSKIVIRADYTVPVSTVFFTYQWRFTEEESAVLF
jgi:hypothetical protein